MENLKKNEGKTENNYTTEAKIRGNLKYGGKNYKKWDEFYLKNCGKNLIFFVKKKIQEKKFENNNVKKIKIN